MLKLRAIKIDQIALKSALNGRSLDEPMEKDAGIKYELKHFSKKYASSKIYAVKDASLTVYGGEIFGFLGPNGAGKSTIIKSTVGIQPITEGSIEICGFDCAKQPVQAKSLIGFVPDHYALYEKLTYTIGMDKYSADMVLLQDGNKLQTSMLNPGYLYNYTPKDYKEVLAKDDLEPTGAVYLNKVFMYNNTDFNGSNADTAKAGQLKNYLTNVWQLAGKSTDAKHISGVSFKPGSTENINMNFLIMLTSEEWCTKLASAYKSFYGKDYVAEKEYKNIGYKN